MSPQSRKFWKKMVDKYGLHGESDAEAIERLNFAAIVVQRNMWRYLFRKHNPIVANSEEQSVDNLAEQSSYGVQEEQPYIDRIQLGSEQLNLPQQHT